MNDVVIRVEGIGKRYRIGARQNKHTTLRDTISSAARAPLRRIQAVAKGHSATLANEMIWALKDVSFEVKQGEVLGIIGRNGAGKSTLLKIMSRITEPSEGFIDIKGRVGSLLEVGTGFHGELTGRENVYLNGAILGMKRREIEHKFDEIVYFAEVEKFIDTPVKHYSSGMHMRLAFAVAAHLEPEILIVDEVLAVGDANFQKKSIGKMGDVAKEGRTVLFVSHNMPAVLNLCTRAILLESGRLTMDSDPETLVRHYLNAGLDVAGTEVFPASRALKYPDTALFFTKISVLNTQNEPTGFIRSSEPFTVQIQYRVIQPVRNVQVAFILWNQDGVPVFTTTDSDGDSSLPEHELEPGDYVATLQIPAPLLRAGRYLIDLVATVPGYRWLDRLEQSLTFEIVDSRSLEINVTQRRHGIIDPVFDWKTEKMTFGQAESERG
jgi:lipopolysaccharide transport system ATP-binding protein